MKTFVINLILAIVWMLLNRSGSLLNFALGFGIGFLLLTIFPGLFSSKAYIRRTFSFIRFIFVFLIAFVKANFSVAAIVLFVPRSKMHPSIFSYDISDLTFVETLILSQCVSLTPGTITVDIEEDMSSLQVHCLDYRNPGQIHDSITNQLKNPIMRFTR